MVKFTRKMRGGATVTRFSDALRSTYDNMIRKTQGLFSIANNCNANVREACKISTGAYSMPLRIKEFDDAYKTFKDTV